MTLGSYPINERSLRVPVDLRSSKILDEHRRLQVACKDGRVIDVRYERNTVFGTVGGREIWRFDNPFGTEVEFDGLGFASYDPCHMYPPYSIPPPGYIFAKLRSARTDSFKDEFNRGSFIELNPLDGKVNNFVPSVF